MTFVYRNTSTLYTRPIARSNARFGNNLCNWDILWMRELANVAGIQIGIGIQRIRVYRARRMANPLRARSQPVYTMYGFALSCTYDSSSERVSSWNIARVGGTRIRYIAPRRSTDKSEIYGRPLFPLSLTSIGYIAFDTSKRSPSSPSNCESEEIQMQFIVAALSQRSV